MQYDEDRMGAHSLFSGLRAGERGAPGRDRGGGTMALHPGLPLVHAHYDARQEQACLLPSLLSPLIPGSCRRLVVAMVAPGLQIYTSAKVCI